MKRLFNIIVCACALAMASCMSDGATNEPAENAPSQDKGALVLNVGTRAADGTERDYLLLIYKNEADKATLVRKYDSSKSDMQKPEYIWLLEGNYTAVVESGKAVSATFDEAEQYFLGEATFDIKGGETSTVDVVASMQNIAVEVLFDQSIVDGFQTGYGVEVKADDNTLLNYNKSQKGFFIMPEGCTTLTWHFVGTYRYEDGEQVAVDKSGTIENVEPKRAYKLSFKFSPDAYGFLGDGLTILIDESIEERDDHLSFSPDPELKGVGFDAASHCYYAGGNRQYLATAAADFIGVTITAGERTFDPVNESVAGVTLSGLNSPQLYITLSEDFFYALNGGEQIIEMCVMDSGGSEARKELPYTLPGVNNYDKNKEVIAWAGCSSTLSATVFGMPSNVEILYREGEAEWSRTAAAMSEENTYSATIEVAPGRSYEYALAINGKSVGSSRTFTTRDGNQIPNGDLEDWCKNDDGVIIPYHTANNAYWCTGNYGTAILSKNITQSSSDVRPGSKGTKSMYMDSEYIVVKFAAGNGYIGSWGGMDGTNAKVYFGQPFEFNAKPKAIRFWAKWNCGTIDKVSSNVGKKGDPDLCKFFCCFTTDTHLVDSSKGKETTFSPSDADIKSGDARYNKVLYSAYMDTTESNNEWTMIEIPFTFYGTDPNQVPSHIILTFTCSGYGDFFDGSTNSWLYVDDIELVY